MFLAALSPVALGVASCGSAPAGDKRDTGQDSFTITEVARFDHPWAMAFVPGTPYALITERRGRLKLWEEGGVFPQVVIEVRSPSNRGRELRRKYHFYQRYGAMEYVLIDPDRHTLKVYHRTPAGRLQRVPIDPAYISPLLGVMYVQRPDGLTVFYPTGEPFLTFDEIGEKARQADAERQRAERERRRADIAQQRADALAAKLRELGLDPDAL